MSNLTKQNNFFSWVTDLFKPTGQNAQAIETHTSTGYIANDYWHDLENWEDNLQKFYEPLKGLSLSKAVCRQLELKIVNDPVLASCFEKLSSMADTKFEVELELENKALQEQVLEALNEELPKLFYVATSLRDISQFIIQRIVTYGVFAGQFGFDETQRLNQVIIPPPYSVKWARTDDKWQLIQEFGGRRIALNRETFIYEPIAVIQNERGIWPIPPFKAALAPANTYELFIESLAQIARRTGMNKVLDIIMKPFSPSVPQTNNAMITVKTGTQEFEKQQSQQNPIMNRFAAMFQRTLPNGYLIHPDTIEVKELATYEPSANISAFHDLLASQVVLGCKLYPALVGIVTRENQTTLSTNQKLATKAFVETIQGKADAVLKKVIQMWLISNGYIVKNIKIEREPVQIESTLEDQQAKKVKLENEQLERQLEQNEESSKIDEQGSTKEDEASQEKPKENEIETKED